MLISRNMDYVASSIRSVSRGRSNRTESSVTEKCRQPVKKDADHFASLAPKPPEAKKKQRFNLDIFDAEDEDAANIANMEFAMKKQELELEPEHLSQKWWCRQELSFEISFVRGCPIGR